MGNLLELRRKANSEKAEDHHDCVDLEKRGGQLSGMVKMLAVVLGLLVGLSNAFAAAGIKVLLITGGHGFERQPFFAMFQQNPDFAVTHMEHGKNGSEAYDREDLLTFDAVVLYDMVQKITPSQKERFLDLFEKGVGLVVLHHALVSYQEWPEFERVIGGRYPEDQSKKGKVTEAVGYLHDQKVPVQIVAKRHPITAGLEDFVLHDEIYWGYRVGKDVTPLITTSHPKSAKPLGWTREEKKSRVVYLQCGHGPEAFVDSNYKKLLSQSIQWVARK